MKKLLSALWGSFAFMRLIHVILAILAVLAICALLVVILIAPYYIVLMAFKDLVKFVLNIMQMAL